MAKRKYYGYEQAKLFVRYGSTREATWRRYKTQYRKISESYGSNMSPMLSKDEFLKAYRKEIELSDFGRAPSIRSFTYDHVYTTHKEAKAAATNFNNNMTKICDKANNGYTLSKFEYEMLDQHAKIKEINGEAYYVPIKVTYRDVRANSDKWQDIYNTLEDNNVQNQMLGSK